MSRMVGNKRSSSSDAQKPYKKVKIEHGSAAGEKEKFLDGISSKEAHQKQKVLKQERVAAKPNADLIARSKKLWEKLRLKSHVPKEERQKLVAELFDIITGRVKDFVFKHDSVRVIQCALKYATVEQKKQIAQELRGSYRELAESRYGKFLIAKMVVGDNETRDMVVPEFYGQVKRLIRHPEASWIMDDIYRTLATKEQKALLLREWYGPEFVVFGKSEEDEKITAELSEILKQMPAKRGPIMQHLKEMTNQLVQKKTSGFTILHDALLQYFLNCKPGSPEHTEFLEMLKDDEEGDLFKNLAFTKSGSRLVCLALAHGSSKDRRTILKHFKTHIKLLAADPYGHTVLITAYEVIDDTVMVGKAIFSELLSKDLDEEGREQEMIGLVTNLNGRIPLLHLMSPDLPKWLVDESDKNIINEIRALRTETSKKDPETRRTELLKAISQPLLDLITSQAKILVQTSFGCQFIAEVLFSGIGEKQAALEAVGSLAEVSSNADELLSTPHAGRMLKCLVQGGRFDKDSKKIVFVDPLLGFHNVLYTKLEAQKGQVLSWATGPNSFSIVAMLEAPDFGHKEELIQHLRKQQKKLQDLPAGDKSASAGTRIILEKIGSVAPPDPEKPNKTKAKKRK